MLLEALTLCVTASVTSMLPGWLMEIFGGADSASLLVSVRVTAPALNGDTREYVTP